MKGLRKWSLAFRKVSSGKKIINKFLMNHEFLMNHQVFAENI
jgi:hypothetical protein